MFTPLACTNIKGSMVPAALTGTCMVAFECVRDGADGGGSTSHGDKLRGGADRIFLDVCNGWCGCGLSLSTDICCITFISGL